MYILCGAALQWKPDVDHPAVTAHDFSVSVIPHTAEVTTLGSKKEGDIVNLETDIIGKYVEKLLHPQEEKKESHITREFLENCGF